MAEMVLLSALKGILSLSYHSLSSNYHKESIFFRHITILFVELPYLTKI